MSSTIKNIGIAVGAGILLLIVFLVFSILLLGYEIFGASNIEYYHEKFLLTAKIEIDGKIKTSSSVYEISYNRRTHGGGQGFQSSPINGVKGALPVIDLGEGNYLVFSFYPFSSKRHIPKASLMGRGLCSGVNVRHVPTTVMIHKKISKQDSKLGFREKVDLVKSIGFDEKINFENYSLTVYYAQKNKPYKKENKFLFCDASTILGPSVKPVSLTIQKTNLENKVINNLPPWLVNLIGAHFLREEFK